MKKRFAFIIALVAMLFVATGCGGNKKCEHVDKDDDLKCDLCGVDFEDGAETPVEYEFNTPVTDRIIIFINVFTFFIATASSCHK